MESIGALLRRRDSVNYSETNQGISEIIYSPSQGRLQQMLRVQ